MKTSDCKHVDLGLRETRFSFLFPSLFFLFLSPLFLSYIYIYFFFSHTMYNPLQGSQPTGIEARPWLQAEVDSGMSIPGGN